MSFDLYFCWRKPERMNFEKVKAWAKGIEYLTRKNAQLWYSNPKTGVYFSFDFEAEAPESPEDGPDESVVAANSEALTQSWVHHNQRAILVMIEQPKFSRPLTMPPPDSLYLWRYGKAKEDLERTCGEGVFVPSLVPVQRKGDARVGRATVYTEGLPTIIPECEWVFIVRRRKAFFRSKKDVAAISAQTFREMLTGHIQSFHWKDPNVQIIDAESAGKLAKS
jgi:hypothetical protein